MSRLCYERYVAQGGDWGSIVVNFMAIQEPPGLAAIRTNMPEVIPPEVDAAIWSGGPLPAGLSEEERRACEQVRENKFAYAFQMGTRPQTLTGLVDSPVDLAAFMIDHDWKSHALIARAFAGVNEGLTRDDVLDNISSGSPARRSRRPVSTGRIPSPVSPSSPSKASGCRWRSASFPTRCTWHRRAGW